MCVITCYFILKLSLLLKSVIQYSYNFQKEEVILKNHHHLIRNLRKERKLSQQFLSEGITTREAVSRFENRGTNITADTLFQFLDKMNVTLEEYHYLLNDFELSQKQEKYREG